MLTACSYGMISPLYVDPIEKKPLYHYHPGSEILSIGGVGCNMSCRHCQNHSISQNPRSHTVYGSPRYVIDNCRALGFDAIAFTYNEPIIWYEYIMDIARLDPDLRLVLVTNGLVSDAPLRDLCKVTDAVNMDVKGFTERFYREVCDAHLSDVLRSAETVFSEGVHLELTYLIIPGMNDTDDELHGFSAWVRDRLSPYVPIHFTRFHPDYLMRDIGSTSPATMHRAFSIAKDEGLVHIYIGNMLSDEGMDTVCPGCGSRVIIRSGRGIDTTGLDGSRCSYCGEMLNIIR